MPILRSFQHRTYASYIRLIKRLSIVPEDEPVTVILNDDRFCTCVFGVLQQLVDEVIAVGIVAGKQTYIPLGLFCHSVPAESVSFIDCLIVNLPHDTPPLRPPPRAKSHAPTGSYGYLPLPQTHRASQAARHTFASYFRVAPPSCVE